MCIALRTRVECSVIDCNYITSVDVCGHVDKSGLKLFVDMHIHFQFIFVFFLFVHNIIKFPSQFPKVGTYDRPFDGLCG